MHTIGSKIIMYSFNEHFMYPTLYYRRYEKNKHFYYKFIYSCIHPHTYSIPLHFFFFSKSLCLSNCFFMIRSKRNVLAIKICSNDFFFFDLLRFQWTRRIQKCVRRFLIGWFDDFFSFRVKRTSHRVFYSLWCGFLYPEHIIPVGEKAAEFLHDTSQSVHFPPDGTKYFSKFSTIRPLGFFRETLFGLGVV